MPAILYWDSTNEKVYLPGIKFIFDGLSIEFPTKIFRGPTKSIPLNQLPRAEARGN